MTKRALAVAAVVGLLAGCSSSGSSDNSGGHALKGSIRVDAASSLTEAFAAIRSGFEHAHPGTTVDITYGASSDLSTQISQGASVDVFASAAPANMKSLGSQAIAPKDFVRNTAEIALPPGNPAHITSVGDLAKPGVKVAVCAPAVPCGAVATAVFENAKITVHPKASLANVKSTLAAVESGEVDAGVVYVSDVRSAGNKVTGLPIPPNVNASTSYPIAALKGSHNPALAKAFVAYVLSPAGRKVLLGDGFRAP